MENNVKKIRREKNKNNKIIENYNNIIGEQRQEIISILSNFNKLDNEMTDYLNLIEKNIKKRED